MNLSAALLAACFAVFRFPVFRLPDIVHPPAYAVIAIAGILATLWLSLRSAPLRALSPEALWDAGFFAVIAAFIISRVLGFLLLLAIGHGHLTLSFADVLRFSSISYLSLIVTAIFVALYLRWKRLPILRVMDAWAPCGALLWTALSFAGATAPNPNGLPTELPWGIRTATATRAHPVELYSAALALALCGTLFTLLKRLRTPGRVAAIALFASGLIVFLLDMLRIPDQLAHTLLDNSQWLALLAIVAGGCLFAAAPQNEVR